MPKSSTDTTPTELIPSEPTATASATPKWDKVEQERLTRRAALRKMGYTSGIAMFSMFAVDDLARMAIKKMEQHKETKQIAETVAKEFKNSGIAMANPNYSNCGGCVPDCKAGAYQECIACDSGCPGSWLNTISCGDARYTQAQCRACCSTRNPGPITPANTNYSWCITWGNCNTQI